MPEQQPPSRPAAAPGAAQSQHESRFGALPTEPAPTGS